MRRERLLHEGGCDGGHCIPGHKRAEYALEAVQPPDRRRSRGRRGARLLSGHPLVLCGSRQWHGGELHHHRRRASWLRGRPARDVPARGGGAFQIVVLRGGEPGRGGAERLVLAAGAAGPIGVHLRCGGGGARWHHPEDGRFRNVSPADQRCRRRRARGCRGALSPRGAH